MSIPDKLTQINDIKIQLKEEIEKQGVVVAANNFDQYPYLVSLITGGATSPVLVEAPVITGDAWVGGVLTVSRGVWTGNPTPDVAFDWHLNGSSTGITTTTLNVATAGDYTVVVTATNTSGSANTTTAAVTATEAQAVYDGSLVDQNALEDQAFTYNVSTAFTGVNIQYSASGLPTGLSIDQSSGVISGTPTQVVENQSVTITATTTHPTPTTGGFSITVAAKAIAPLVNTVPPVMTSPAGTEVGSTFITDTGTWTYDASYPPTFTIEWLRNGTPVAGASGTSYTTSAADAGATIKSKVTGNSAQYEVAVESSNEFNVGQASGINIFRSNYGSDSAYISDLRNAIEEAVRGDGRFDGAVAGSDRQINIDGIVTGTWQPGNGGTIGGLEGRVRIIGSGYQTTKFYSYATANHNMDGGTTNRNVDIFMAGMEIGLGPLYGERATPISQIWEWRGGNWREVVIGTDLGFNRYDTILSGWTDVDYTDIRNYFNSAIISGVTQAEYDAIVPMSTMVGFSGYETRIEEKEWLGSNSCKVWLNNSDAGSNSPKWNVSLAALSPGMTMSWPGGSGTCDSKIGPDQVTPALCQSTGNNWYDFICNALLYKVGEIRVTAERRCWFQGVWDWVGCGDYWKQQGNSKRQFPTDCRIYRAVALNSMPGRPAVSAHSDIIQWFDSNVDATTVFLLCEDVMFGLGWGVDLGHNPAGFGDWGSAGQVTFASGSRITNCFFDTSHASTFMINLDGPLEIDRLVSVNSGNSGYDGGNVLDAVIRPSNTSQRLVKCICCKVSPGGTEVDVLQIGTHGAGGVDYNNYFPNFGTYAGRSLEDTLRKYSPGNATYEAYGPITQAGEFKSVTGEILWDAGGYVPPPDQPPVLTNPIGNRSATQGSVYPVIQLNDHFASATSYASDQSWAAVTGSQLQLDTANLIAGESCTITASGDVAPPATDSFTWTVTEAVANPIVNATNEWQEQTGWTRVTTEPRNTSMHLIAATNGQQYTQLVLTAAEHPQGVTRTLKFNVGALNTVNAGPNLGISVRRLTESGSQAGPRVLSEVYELTTLTEGQEISLSWNNPEASGVYGTIWEIRVTETPLINPSVDLIVNNITIDI